MRRKFTGQRPGVQVPTVTSQSQNDPGQFAQWLLDLIANPGQPLRSVLKEKNNLLSKQEQLILRHIAGGKTTQEIATSLSISPLTVKTHRKNLFRKLDAGNSAALVRIAGERGLI